MSHTVVLLYIVLGLFVGWAWGDQVRRRRAAEAKLAELTKRLEKASVLLNPDAQLKKIVGIVADTHKKITAVSKGLEKHPS